MNSEWTRGDFAQIGIGLLILGFVGGAVSCAKVTDTASEACRALAGEPDNNQIQWDAKTSKCVRYMPPVPLTIEAKP